MSNVVRLPAAARRQVRQYRNKDTRAAASALRKQHGDRFEYVAPWVRKMMPLARDLHDTRRSPEMEVLQCLLMQLPHEQRVLTMLMLKAAEDKRPSLKAARAIVEVTTLNVGDMGDLNAALDRC